MAESIYTEVDLDGLEGGKVFVKFSIDTLNIWSYTYSKLDGDVSQGHENPDEDHEFEIGTPEDLRGLVNYFEIDLTNATSQKQPYDIVVEWFHQPEGGEKTSKGKWTRQKSLYKYTTLVRLQWGADFS